MSQAIKMNLLIQESLTVEFKQLDCGGCGITYFVPTTWYNERVNNRGSFSCPNGCSRIFTAKSKEELLKEQFTKDRESYQSMLRTSENEIQRLKSLLTAQTNTEIKSKAGTCKICNRDFKNLKLHNEIKYP